MKKLKYVFSLLNKKGVYVLGFLCGVLLSLFMMFSVYAGEYIPQYSLTAICDWVGKDGISHTIFVDSNDSFLIAGFVAPNGSYAFRTNSDVMFCTTNLMNCDYYSGSDAPTKDSGVSPWEYSGTPVVYMPMFDTEEHRNMYLEGTLTNEEVKQYCLNYDAIQEMNKKHDTSIPVPVKAYISTISTSTVSTTFSYDETELDNFKNETGYDLQYEYEVEYFYQMLSKAEINNQASSINVEEVNKSKELQYALNDFQLFEADNTCESVYNAATASNNKAILNSLATADSGTYSSTGVVNLSNAVTSSPPNYYEKYSIPFSLFSMEYHMQFIVAQARITSFYVDPDGIKHCSDDIYIRRALWDKDNEHYGSTFTRITKDENGNDTFQSSFQMDSNGENMSSSLGDLNSDSLINHIQNGFGLTGSNGYIEMNRRFLIGVPEYIWLLIAMAMSVSIIVISFKVLRGM